MFSVCAHERCMRVHTLDQVCVCACMSMTAEVIPGVLIWTHIRKWDCFGWSDWNFRQATQRFCIWTEDQLPVSVQSSHTMFASHALRQESRLKNDILPHYPAVKLLDNLCHTSKYQFDFFSPPLTIPVKLSFQQKADISLGLVE